ncbi:Olfactory receptor 14K1 [Fukomys damarensis]|uniref:Olfactory receptor 14K1 n=1 Tax=Fukomys damarensis TaxID=885580 RepID=A0A091D7H9_FUKDA|nr:Olfactory receptor 14K1 [Fukomys damarensis]
MYFFLRHLSFLDLCFISTTVPKSILNTLTFSDSISFLGCVCQLFLVIMLEGSEVGILTAMSYDRYVAICHPLHYEAAMSKRCCVWLMVVSWLSGVVFGILYSAGTFSLEFCGSNRIHQFFCDVPALLMLTCSEEHAAISVNVGLGVLYGFSCLVCIMVSYVFIFSTVLKMPSREGRSKAFSTCVPHLVVVGTFLLTEKWQGKKLDEMRNFTAFLLMGFSDDPLLQKVYAMVFSLVYLAALTGNLLIIALTTADQHLQSPLYFFLKNLSFIDTCYISVTVPKSIMNSLTNIYSISFLGCAMQVFFLFFLCGTEYALLLVMSYDRYAAICHPLHYEVLMNRGSCVQMVMASWLGGCIYGALHTAGTFSVSFCETNKSFLAIVNLCCLTKHVTVERTSGNDHGQAPLVSVSSDGEDDDASGLNSGWTSDETLLLTRGTD